MLSSLQKKLQKNSENKNWKSNKNMNFTFLHEAGTVSEKNYRNFKFF